MLATEIVQDLQAALAQFAAIAEDLGVAHDLDECLMGRIMRKRPSFNDFLTNLDQPMPLPEKLTKLTRNLWRRVVLRQTCCGHDGEPGC